MSELATLWAELRRDTAKSDGIVRRRVCMNAPCRVFAAVEQPEGRPCLIAEFDQSVRLNQRRLPRSKGFTTAVQTMQSGREGPQKRRLVILLTDSAFEDVFSVLCADICKAMESAADQQECVAAGIDRLDRWQRFLKRHSGAGLSEEEQRGLVGELVFLRDVVLQRLSCADALASWSGPRGSSQDFEFPAASVEVKTTIASPHQLIRISNVRQLDDAGLPSLFLFVLPMDIHREVGQTLPEIVTEIRKLVHANADEAQVLEDRLLNAGYLDAHAAKYQRDRYSLRPPSSYRVEQGFPRIIESDLAQGVGDVKYSIAVAACSAFHVTEEAVISTMESYGNSD